MGKEIERKWLLRSVPKDLKSCPHHIIEQGYLNTNPVVRIRRQDDTYVLTYKGGGLMERVEYNLPLDRDSYEHLKEKVDGILISKTRYIIPLENGLKIELDHFKNPHEGLYLAEIEFPSVEEAKAYVAPEWFGRDVTYDIDYHNSVMSQIRP